MKHCTDKQLQALATGEVLDDRKELESHLAVCSSCRHQVQVYGQLMSVLAEAPAEELSPNFASSVIGRIEESGTRAMNYLEWGLASIIVLVGVPMVFAYIDRQGLATLARDSWLVLSDMFRSVTSVSSFLVDTNFSLIAAAAVVGLYHLAVRLAVRPR
jgi:anti-sigma factor RsiW